MTSKRGADEYLTRDGVGSEFKVNPENQKQSATLAQMASRNIAQPKGRRSRTAPSKPHISSLPNPFSNPFSTNNQPQQQQPVYGLNGMQFGGNEPFSSSNSAPSASFSFSVPTPISFGENSSAPLSNPFANINGSGNNTQNAAQSEDAMMESPQKKSTFVGFGNNPNTVGTSSPAVFSFGQSQQNGPTLFGSSQPTSAPPASGSLFRGGSKPESAFPPSSLFGRVTGPETSSVSSQAPAPSSLFGQGQNSQPPSSNLFRSTQHQPNSDLQSSSFSFGQTSVSQPPPISSNFGQAQQKSSPFAFGQTASSSQPKNPFGAPNFDKAEAPNQTSPLFGQSNTTAQPASNIFGQAASATPSSGNLFGKPGDASQPPATPLQNSKPLGGLFSQKKESVDKQDSVPTTSETTKAPLGFGAAPQAPNILFSPVENQSQVPQVENQGVTADLTPPSNITPLSDFNFGSASVNNSSSSLFGSPQATEINGSKTADLFSRKSQGPLLSLDDAVHQQKSDESVASTKNQFGSKLSSGKLDPSSQLEKGPVWGIGQPSTDQSPFTAYEAQNSGPSVEDGAAGQTDRDGDRIHLLKPQTPNTTAHTSEQGASTIKANPAASQDKSTLFAQNSNTDPGNGKGQSTQPKSTSLFGSAKPPAFSKSPATSSPQRDDKPREKVKVRARTDGPGFVPRSFDNDERAEHDKSFRLTSLDFGFAQRLASLDFKKHDFSITVRSYIAARESIGQPIGGLYERVSAGAKRKADDGAGNNEDSSHSKKAKSDNLHSNGILSSSQPSSTIPGGQTPSNTSSLFQSMISTPSTIAKSSGEVPPASAPAKATVENTFANSQTGFSANSGSGFKGFQSSNDTKSSSRNPFASIGKTPQSTSTGFQPSMTSTTPTKSPPKKPAFEIPNFGAAANTNFMASFAKQSEASIAKLQAKRKAEEFDSDEETEAEYDAKVVAEEQNKRARLDVIGQKGFQPLVRGGSTPSDAGPVLDSGVGRTDDSGSAASFDSSDVTRGFGQQSKPPPFTFGSTTSSSKGEKKIELSETSEEESAESQDNGDEGADERVDGDYDPDNDQAEDDETNSEEADESEGNIADDDAEESGEDLQAAMEASRQNKGKSLFDRITPPNGMKPISQTSDEPSRVSEAKTGSADSPILQNAPNKSFKPFLAGSDILQSTPSAPAVSPFTPVNGLPAPKQPTPLAKTFNFTPTPPTTTPTPVPGASVLWGGSTKTGFIPGEGLFGSRPSTPNNAESATASLFSTLAKGPTTASPRMDNTWKAGNSITFGTPEKTSHGPAVNITAATPPAKEETTTSKPFSSLFGGSPASNPGSTSASANPLGFQFGTSVPGYLGAASHLLPSANSSAVSSRATSPGLTDNESIATNDSEDQPNDPQTSLMASRAGEEGEEVLYEGRAKALRWFDEDTALGKSGRKPNDYNTMGLGEVRILNNAESGKARVLFRAEPSSNIVINSNLNPSVSYTSVSSGSTGNVKFPIFTAEGIEKWVLKTKTKEMSDKLAAVMEDNKGQLS